TSTRRSASTCSSAVRAPDPASTSQSTGAAERSRMSPGSGLMIMWPTDLIVAGEDARFADPVTAFGMSAVELFMHPWELGARRAKERLLTGDVAAAPGSRGRSSPAPAGSLWPFAHSLRIAAVRTDRSR